MIRLDRPTPLPVARVAAIRAIDSDPHSTAPTTTLGIDLLPHGMIIVAEGDLGNPTPGSEPRRPRTLGVGEVGRCREKPAGSPRW